MTLLQLMKVSGLTYTQEDLQRLGVSCYASARSKQIPVGNVQQEEDGETFTVKDYPDGFAPKMQEIIINYFNRKSDKPKDRYVQIEYSSSDGFRSIAICKKSQKNTPFISSVQTFYFVKGEDAVNKAKERAVKVLLHELNKNL